MFWFIEKAYQFDIVVGDDASGRRAQAGGDIQAHAREGTHAHDEDVRLIGLAQDVVAVLRTQGWAGGREMVLSQ